MPACGFIARFNRGDAQRAPRQDNAVLSAAEGINPLKEDQHSMGARVKAPGGGAIINYADAVEVAPLSDYAEADDSVASDTGGRAGITHAATNPAALKAIPSGRQDSHPNPPNSASPKSPGLEAPTLFARNIYAAPTPMPEGGYYQAVDAVVEPDYATSVPVPLVAAKYGSMPEAVAGIGNIDYEVSDTDGSSAVVPDQLAVLDPAAGSSSEIQTMSASAICYGTSLLNTTLQATPESRGTKEPPADLARLTEYTEVLINRSSGPVQLSTINRLRTELDAIPMDVRDIGCVVKVYGFAGTGTLRFVGKHHVTGDPRFGVEFDGPRGEHDGATGEPAHRYFRCDPGHGVLRHPRTVRRATAEEASSVAISDEVAALVSHLQYEPWEYEVPEYALGPCPAPNDMGNVDIGTEAVQPDYADPLPGSGVYPLFSAQGAPRKIEKH